MCRSMIGLLTALAVVLAPSYLTAEEGKRPQKPRQGAHRKGPSPERLFQRLDANQDKVITAEELPADLPKGFKAMLIRADGNKDGKLTVDELKKAFVRRHDGQKAPAGKKGPPQKKQAKKCPVGKKCPVAKKGNFAKKDKQFKKPDPKKFAKVMFVRLDKNKNGSLSFEEYYEGIRQFYKMCAAKGFKGHKAKKPSCKSKCHAKAKAKCHGKGKAKAKCHVKGKSKCHKKDFAKKHHPKGHKFHAKGHKHHAKGHKHHAQFAKHHAKGHKHHAKGYRPHGANKFAMSHKPHGWPMHAKCPHCCCMRQGMGPWGHPGMARGMNPWQHHGMHHYGMHRGMNPWQGRFPQQNWGKGFPAGPKQMKNKSWDGKKNPWQKPKVKHQKGKAPRMGNSDDQRIMQIEARLTNLERQQQAMLVAIQEQQAAMMAALQRTNELVSARLASLGSDEAPVRPTWGERQAEGKVKVVAQVYDLSEQPEESYDRDSE